MNKELENEIESARNSLSDYEDIIGKEDYEFIQKILYSYQKSVEPSPDVEDVSKNERIIEELDVGIEIITTEKHIDSDGDLLFDKGCVGIITNKDSFGYYVEFHAGNFFKNKNESTSTWYVLEEQIELFFRSVK
jgi:hypothetical protein